MKDTGKPGIHQIFCANDNPQGNAETGRVIRTIKEECLWLNDFGSLEEAGTTISAWIGEDYNRLYSTRPWAIG
jgi:putative transposase